MRSIVTEVLTAVAAKEARLNAEFAALEMAGEAAEKAIGEKVAAPVNASMAALMPALAWLRKEKGMWKEGVAEKREVENMAADMAAMKRWGEGDLDSQEWEEAYGWGHLKPTGLDIHGVGIKIRLPMTKILPFTF